MMRRIARISDFMAGVNKTRNATAGKMLVVT